MNWKNNFPKDNIYYETKNGILYKGDCLDIMKEFPKESVDLVLTDPPYGINVDKMGFANNGDKQFGKALAKKTTFKNYKDRPIDSRYFNSIFEISKNQIIWGGNYYLQYLKQTKCMLVWYKRDGLPANSFADCEIAWTSFDKNSMVFNCRWHGFIRDSKEQKTIHPNQKALDVMKWCLIEFSNENDLILDCFAGSGTTLVACEQLDRRWIGIEKEEKYCKITKNRLKKIRNRLI